MAKPERQPASGVALFVDGMLTKRVQSVSMDVDVAREQTLELANTGVVENIREADSVNVEIETNDVGSTDTLALMTDKMIIYGDVVHSTGARNNTDGSQHKWYINADSSNAAYRNIVETDLLNNYTNILVAKNENSTAVARTVWAPRCSVTNYSASYDVNGNATENFTLLSDKKIWFWNTQKSVRLYRPLDNQIAVVDASGTIWNNQIGEMSIDSSVDSSIGFIGLASCIPTDASVLAVLLHDQVVHKDQAANGGVWEFGVYDGADAAEFAKFVVNHVSGSNGLPFATPFVATGSGQRAAILWAGGLSDVDWEADPIGSGEGYELESTSGAVGGIRKGQIKAFLFNRNVDSKATSTAAGKALRLQTVSIDVALGEDRLFELGRQGHYAVSKQTPVPVNITVTANDNDIEYFAWLTGTSKAQTDVGYANSESFTGGNELWVEIYKDTDQTTLLKTVYVNSMDVVSEGFNVSVGGESQQEITFLADNIKVTGSGTNVTGGWYSAG